MKTIKPLVIGTKVGLLVGFCDGNALGGLVGEPATVGSNEGAVGATVLLGSKLGTKVGSVLGVKLGADVGSMVGSIIGWKVGSMLGLTLASLLGGELRVLLGSIVGIAIKGWVETSRLGA